MASCRNDAGASLVRLGTLGESGSAAVVLLIMVVEGAISGLRRARSDRIPYKRRSGEKVTCHSCDLPMIFPILFNAGSVILARTDGTLGFLRSSSCAWVCNTRS